MRTRTGTILLTHLALAALILAACTGGQPANRPQGHHERGGGEADREGQGLAGDTLEETMARENWFFGPRMFPGTRLPDGALVSAQAQARALAGGPHAAPQAAWSNIGPRPVDTENPLYNSDTNGGVYPNGVPRRLGARLCHRRGARQPEHGLRRRRRRRCVEDDRRRSDLDLHR